MSRIEIVRMNVVKAGDHVILANGLGFIVTDVQTGFTSVDDKIGEETGERQLTYLVKLKRFDKHSQETQYTELALNPNGFYLKDETPCMNDIVRVADETRQARLTPAGVASLSNPINLKEVLSQPNCFVKVQTRNGYWFNVDSAGSYQENGMVALKLGQVSLICKYRHRIYANNGQTQQAAEAGGAYFDPYDIIKVELM